MKRKLLLTFMGFLGTIWQIVPFNLRKSYFFFLFILESRGSNTDNGLRRLFQIEDKLSLVVNERALKFGDGEHPKHRLVPYHNFFIKNLKNCKNILDVGCGYGAVSRSIANAFPEANVVGIDNDESRYNQAKYSTNPPNLDFVFADITTIHGDYRFDAVILSNVLEHIPERVSTLRQIITLTNAHKFLIRVPLFERHWTIPLRRELGVNYFQDPDHKIEHKLQEFISEIEESSLKISHIETIWGEIWAVCSNEI